ncbi:hypothetical protein C1645_773189 [Glomus cerebriforme]|uniref:Jacalin-type lectin domain-containing protein n=1 Tax=Glomus cerebriforme TaxID=658196 RepID=A0A397T281_9GLOM|nr:hypothetical protein C1645_773189 [Glomus cerebriforme]
MHTKYEDSLSNGHSKDIKLNQNDFGGESSTLRQRRSNLNNFPTTRPNLPDRGYNFRLNIFSLLIRVILYIGLIGWICDKFVQFGNCLENPFDEGSSGSNYEESELASFRMNKFRVALRDLGITMAKGDIIVQNGDSISKVLFNLDKEVRDTGDSLDDFNHQSVKFFWTLSSEMQAITRAIREEMCSLSDLLSDKTTNFIRIRLSMLEGQISPFQDSLTIVITAIQKIEDSISNAQGYLIDGEQRKRAENELVKVRFTFQMLKDITPNLINFESFLKDYRRKIQELSIQIKAVPKKLTEEDTKYLEKAVTDLKCQYAKFSSAIKKLGSKPIESYYIEDEMNSKNRDCTEFRALLKFSNAYLKTIKIWSSEMVNAIAFIYTDGTSKIYGLPNDRNPYIFDWRYNEKIKHINIRIGAVLFAIQFETDYGRVSDWVGGSKGDEYVVYSRSPSIGIHGSFSRQICSIGIIAN